MFHKRSKKRTIIIKYSKNLRRSQHRISVAFSLVKFTMWNDFRLPFPLPSFIFVFIHEFFVFVFVIFMLYVSSALALPLSLLQFGCEKNANCTFRSFWNDIDCLAPENKCELRDGFVYPDLGPIESSWMNFEQ